MKELLKSAARAPILLARPRVRWYKGTDPFASAVLAGISGEVAVRVALVDLLFVPLKHRPVAAR